MILRCLVVLLVLAGFSSVALSQEADALAPSAEGSGGMAADVVATPAMATISVDVVRLTDGGSEPVEAQDVTVHLIVPPHELFGSVQATTDAAGRASVDVPRAEATEAVVEVDIDARRYFSDTIDLGAETIEPVRIETLGVTHDPSSVEATEVVTVVSLSEGYLVIQQAWRLVTNVPAIFRPDMSNPGQGMAGKFVMIPVPAEAEGASIVEPAGVGRVVGSAIFYGGEVVPASMTEDTDRIIIQYSIPTEMASSVSFAQPTSMNIGRASLIVPFETHYSRYPRVNVTIEDVPCTDAVVCWGDRTTDRSLFAIDLGLDAVQVSATDVNAGRQIVVSTSGWPEPRTFEKYAAGAAGAAAVLIGFGLIGADIRRRRGRDRRSDAMLALVAEREELLNAVASLDARLDAGELLERDHAAARAHLRERLGVLYRRIREASEHADPARGEPR